MRLAAFARLAGQVYDAALTPALWPGALEALGRVVGADGAACFIRDRKAGRA